MLLVDKNVTFSYQMEMKMKENVKKNEVVIRIPIKDDKIDIKNISVDNSENFKFPLEKKYEVKDLNGLEILTGSGSPGWVIVHLPRCIYKWVYLRPPN